MAEVSWCIGCESFHEAETVHQNLCPACRVSFNPNPIQELKDDVKLLCFLGLGLVAWHVWTLL